ncbi:MAG TPA: D-amino acid aminotransferase [Longimicrobiales bacterium]
MLVYLNGDYLPQSEARISVDDRGFLFSDGVYEVIRVYRGRPYLLPEHLCRLAAGVQALEIRFDRFDELRDAAQRLIQENGVDGDANIYIQITRGAAPRKHAFPPADTPPTVYIAVKPITPHPEAYYREGVDAITTPDTRWARCDIKTVSLLPNVLANQKAHAAGAFEALFVRDGIVLEGSHSNLLAVVDGAVVTYPKCNYILPGITRDRVLAIAAKLGIPVREGPIFADRLFDVDELFLSGTTTEVMPIARVDGRPIGNGKPGPVTLRLQEAYRAETGA